MNAFAEMGLFSANTNVNNELISIQSPDVILEVIRRLNLDVTYKTDGQFHKETLYGRTLPIKVEFKDLAYNDFSEFKLNISKGNLFLSEFELNDEDVGNDTLIIAKTDKEIVTPIGKLTILKSPYFKETAFENMDIYVSGHPLDDDTDLLKKNVTADSRRFVVSSDEDGDGEGAASGEFEKDTVKDGENVVVGGMITAARQQITKKNTIMCFLTIEDLFGSLEIVVFPNQYDRFRSILNEGNKVLVKGHVQTRDERDPQLICDDIKEFSGIPKKIWVQFETKKDLEEGMEDLEKIIEKSDGTDSVVLYVRENKERKELPPSKTLKGDSETLEELKAVFGEENIAVTQKKVEFQRNRY